MSVNYKSNITVRTLITVILTLLFASACQTTTTVSIHCPSEDMLNWVKGIKTCFAVETYKPTGSKAAVLVITLHGDLSGGGKADYTFDIAKIAASEGAIGVSIMRPGYTGGQKTSSGTPTRNQVRHVRYSAEEADDIGAAVTALKAHHDVSRVIMFGHSGGAAISGVIVGRSAPLVNDLVLLACPCDVATWRQRNGWEPYVGAASPHEYVSSLPDGTRIIALTGSDDNNTGSYLANDYVARAKAAGIQATFIEIPGAGHNYRAASMESYIRSAIKDLINM